jgi:hypothetical protein
MKITEEVGDFARVQDERTASALADEGMAEMNKRLTDEGLERICSWARDFLQEFHSSRGDNPCP